MPVSRCRRSTSRCLTRADMIAVIRRLIKVATGVDRQGRHRPSRQPPRAFGRRAAAEPVPRRSAASRARRARAHDGARHRNGHAAGADQHPSGRRGDQRVLRLLAALAVHGPDELAGRTHAQAPSLGARARAAFRASAPASKSATSTTRTTAASARSRRRKARTSV